MPSRGAMVTTDTMPIMPELPNEPDLDHGTTITHAHHVRVRDIADSIEATGRTLTVHRKCNDRILMWSVIRIFGSRFVANVITQRKFDADGPHVVYAIDRWMSLVTYERDDAFDS